MSSEFNNTNNNIPNQSHIDAKDNRPFSLTKKLKSSQLFINVQEQSPITTSSSSHSSNLNQINNNDSNLTPELSSRLNNSPEDSNNDVSISNNEQENPYYFSSNYTDSRVINDINNFSKVLIKQKKNENITENNAFTSPKDSPNANESPTVKHMEQLVNGMMNLLHKYNDTEQKDNSINKNNDDFIEASHSLYFTSNQKNDHVMKEKEQGKLKHELVTMMRDSLPLNYLIDLNKKNGNQPLQWHPCRYESCHNIYKSKGSLHRHVYSHTGEKPYICQFPGCDKSYSASDRLAEHMHTHTNSRPYKCVFPKCNKAYNDPKTLREHKKTHGEKTFLCNMIGCNKAFHRKTHLKQHMRTHNKLDGTCPLFGEPKKDQEEDNNTPSPAKDLSRSLLNDNDDKHFKISQKMPSPEK